MLEARPIETPLGELWLTDEGDRIELDLLHRMEVPVELDEDAVRELHAYLGVWLDEKRGPQQELEVEEPVERAPAPVNNLAEAAEAAGLLSDPSEKELGPFARDSETSRQAALAAYPKQHTQRWMILELYCNPTLAARAGRPVDSRGFTRDEMAQATGMSPNTIRPRVVELVEGGWLEVLEGVTRPSAAGHDSEVLGLSGKARGETSVA